MSTEPDRLAQAHRRWLSNHQLPSTWGVYSYVCFGCLHLSSGHTVGPDQADKKLDEALFRCGECTCAVDLGAPAVGLSKADWERFRKALEVPS